MCIYIFISMKPTNHTLCHLYVHIFKTDHLEYDNLPGFLSLKNLFFLP